MNNNMVEPSSELPFEALSPFSKRFQSQLSDVLSRQAKVSHVKSRVDDKRFLETEIDTYSGEESEKVNSPRKPPTPPKPSQRTFTFDKTNPFSEQSNVPLSLPRYAEVNKPKNRPKIATKPQIRSVTNSNSLTYSRKQVEQQVSTTESFLRVNSLPDLARKNGNTDEASGKFQVEEPDEPSTQRYGLLNKNRHDIGPNASDSHKDLDNCGEFPEANENNINTAKSEGRYENIYEDVNAKDQEGDQGRKLLSVEDVVRDSDYTLMYNSEFENNFAFGRGNCKMARSSNLEVFTEYENIRTLHEIADPNVVGLPAVAGYPGSIAESKEHVSPTSSVDGHDSPAYSIQSSMASTVASSFNPVQVCFFPPSPTLHHQIVQPGSLKSSSSRSKIPVPIKPKSKEPKKASDRLPTTPTSPDTDSKNLKPTIQMARDDGVAVSVSAKGAKWYEKLGCIQTDTIGPSEPYGRPGERRRSKSLNRAIRKKSQFFVTVEPNASDSPLT